MRPLGAYLRVIDPATGAPVFVPDEIQGALDAARERLDQTEQALVQEQQARQMAEQHVRQAEAELRELRAALARDRQQDAAGEPRS